MASAARVAVAFPAEGKVIVDGVNVAKRHQKPPAQTKPGGIIDKDMPIDVSNVADRLPELRQAAGSATASSPTAPRSASAGVRGRSPVSDTDHHGRGAPPQGSATTTRSARSSRTPSSSATSWRSPASRRSSSTWASAQALQQQSLLDGAVRDLERITGQKPVVTKAKKSIAGFKLREGNAIGAKVTLRGDRMWEFFDRLISLAIPRIRDFRGLNPRSFDGRGNYTFGVTEQLIFPEIDYDKVDATRGMDITIVTTARTNAEGKALLDAFGFPFKREGQQ